MMATGKIIVLLVDIMYTVNKFEIISQHMFIQNDKGEGL